jgi:hypothetical protein
MEPKPLFKQVNDGQVLYVSYNDFRRLIEACGYRYQGPRGIRHVFTHPKVPEPLVLQVLRNQDAKPEDIQKFVEIAKEHALSP